MSDVKKIATRDSYGNALVELGKEHENLVVLDADLAAATKTGVFKKVFPERHIDCGIAECNMMGVAAGLATTGKVPFASSFAMFAAGRAFEQIRNSIGYPKLNVKIGATHAGISVGEDGATHQCNEDIALMRTIPGMVVINPSDDVEARAAVKAAYKHEGPVYLRFGRLAVPVINDREDYKFELGGLVYITAGVSEWKFENGVAGFGFLALAVMIFGQWKPVNIGLAALLFGLFRALSNVYTGFDALVALKLPSTVYNMLPYIISLIVLIFVSKKSRAPKAEGIPYDKGQR